MKKIAYTVLLGLLMASCRSAKNVYLFTSFHEPADAGLRLLYSYDGYKWNDFDTTFIKPEVGYQKVMRDPSMIQSPDGVFHLVWTSSWHGDKGFGYADSKDLMHWSAQRLIPVMADEPTTLNVWAPELFYDADSSRYIIVWASCIPGRFARGQEGDSNNHRLYYTTTKDFKTFAPEQLLFDPGYSVIDAQIVQMNAGKYVLVFKDNTRPERDIKVAFADHATGPYTNDSKPFTAPMTEGPNVAKVKGGWLVYYDAYRLKKFGAAFTPDFKSFTDYSDKVQVPDGHKHGTVLMISRKTLNHLKKELGKK